MQDRVVVTVQAPEGVYFDEVIQAVKDAIEADETFPDGLTVIQVADDAGNIFIDNTPKSPKQRTPGLGMNS